MKWLRICPGWALSPLKHSVKSRTRPNSSVSLMLAQKTWCLQWKTNTPHCLPCASDVTRRTKSARHTRWRRVICRSGNYPRSRTKSCNVKASATARSLILRGTEKPTAGWLKTTRADHWMAMVSKRLTCPTYQSVCRTSRRIQSLDSSPSSTSPRSPCSHRFQMVNCGTHRLSR